MNGTPIIPELSCRTNLANAAGIGMPTLGLLLPVLPGAFGAKGRRSRAAGRCHRIARPITPDAL